MAIAGLSPILLTSIGLPAGWVFVGSAIIAGAYFIVHQVYVRRRQNAAQKLSTVPNRVGFWRIERERT